MVFFLHIIIFNVLSSTQIVCTRNVRKGGNSTSSRTFITKFLSDFIDWLFQSSLTWYRKDSRFQNWNFKFKIFESRAYERQGERARERERIPPLLHNRLCKTIQWLEFSLFGVFTQNHAIVRLNRPWNACSVRSMVYRNTVRSATAAFNTQMNYR